MAIIATLTDDGTMDTVVDCVCDYCGENWQERFGCELASEYRDDDGSLRPDALAELVAAADVYCECEEG